MKIWYLKRDCDYAIVLADTIEEAFKKAEKITGFSEEDWEAFEEFKKGVYEEDVIWFY